MKEMNLLDPVFQLSDPPEFTDDEGSMRFSEHKLAPEIYQKAKNPVKIDGFKTFFS